jgi:hypothetical protein
MATPRPKVAARGKQPARARRSAARRATTRPDYGQPIEGFFARQPAHLRAILEALRALVEAAAPDATSSIKWGMPFYCVEDRMFCALGAHRSHVNLILWGPPGAFADPAGRLAGAGRTGRHLKLAALDELPRAAVRGWLRTAAGLARRRR